MIPDAIFSDITIRFPHDPETGRVGLQLIPTALAHQTAPRRTGLAGLPCIDAIPDTGNPPAIAIDPLVHLKIVGDPYPGAFAQGHTMRGAPSIDRFRYQSQQIERDRESNRTVIRTFLQNRENCRIEHRLSWREGDAAAEVQTFFHNGSPHPVTLEMLTSFSLGGITPFHSADAPGRLRVHRFRSAWSAEARLESRSIEDLHLERSWSGAGAFSERFGQLGTLPVRRWFPFVAVEDTGAHVTWGAQLAWAGSWQLEIFRQHDDVCLSGGLADREFGHWMKTVVPGETLATPPAFLSCVAGDLDDLCDRLTTLQHRAADTHPEVERDLPIVFNEWCTTWGDPQHDRIVALAERLKASEVRYLVIDAGWYKTAQTDWSSGHGDWIPSKNLFPTGLAATADAIRKAGLIPGLWFEMETVGSQSSAFTEYSDQMLQRDSQPITVRERRFWNLSDPQAIAYLTEKVIDRLRECGFGYLKIDYNETAGLGCDHPDSPGEGLRKQVLASYRFFDKIRTTLPELVIENCASGGHRLEPSMLARSAMSSFSDAHELVEIPIIAANLHRLVLPRQSQIWAVLHPSDSLQRLAYSLAATFLGRMCLSGDITGLSPEQWQLVLRAQQLYKKATPIIKHGTSRRFGKTNKSWRHPRGWQAIVRTSADSRRALVVLHAFADAPEKATLRLPWTTDDAQIHEQFPHPTASIQNHSLHIPIPSPFSATVLLLECGAGSQQTPVRENHPVPASE